MATILCEHCGEKFTSLAKHWAKSRRCASQYKPKDLDHEMEEENFRRSHHHNVLRAHVAETLQHFRYDKYVPDNIMEELKPALRKIRKVELDILRAEIEPLLAPGKQQQLSKALSGLEDPFYSLSTAKREKAFARDVQKLPYVQKRVRNLQSPGKSVSSKDMKRHGTVGFSLVDILTRVMQNDRKACADIIAKSDQWKTGDMHEKLADAYRDIDDGENFRFHPHLARKATEAEADVVRIALQLYNDGVTVANPIGYAKGEQKYECTYVAISNLAQRLRFNMDMIQVLELTNAKAFKLHGAARVFCGVGADGKKFDEPNMAADLRRLADGVEIKIPKDEGGTRTIRLQAFVIGLSADFPAAGALLPAMESTSAHLWCRECDLDTRCCATSRCCFSARAEREAQREAQRAGDRQKRKREQLARAPRLKRAEPLRAEIRRLRVLRHRGSNVAKEMAQLGTNKLFYAFDSDYMPHVDETTMVPYDTMHVELDGLVRQELAHLLFVLITKRKRFTMEKLNAAIKSFAWPPGQRMPEIEAKIIEGAKGGVPKADAKLSSSASQTLHFALASELIIGGLLSEDAKREPAWQCWLKHAQYLSIVVQRVISRDELERLGALIEEHQKAHAQVSEYAGLEKPKHHMALHVVRDIERNGPPRGFWCMAFEAFNQVIKKMFNKSNYKSAAVSVADFWSMRSARTFRLGRAAEWFQDSACAASELTCDVTRMCEGSDMVSAACSGEDRVVAARQLHSFTRGSVAVKVGSWVQCECVQTGERQLMRVGELVQVFSADRWVIRMLGLDCMPAPEERNGAWMSVHERDLTGESMMVDVEEMHLTELHAIRDDGSIRFECLY